MVINMVEIILNGAQLQTRRAIHECLSAQMVFPEYYGYNLDALYDVLTDINQETLIRLFDSQVLAENMGRYAGLLIKLLTEAAKENPLLTVEIL